MVEKIIKIIELDIRQLINVEVLVEMEISRLNKSLEIDALGTYYNLFTHKRLVELYEIKEKLENSVSKYKSESLAKINLLNDKIIENQALEIETDRLIEKHKETKINNDIIQDKLVELFLNSKFKIDTDKIKVEFSFENSGFRWLYTNTKGDTLSVIYNPYSYGYKKGLFEICPSWCNPTENDSVKGHLNFGEVHQWIKNLEIVGED